MIEQWNAGYSTSQLSDTASVSRFGQLGSFVQSLTNYRPMPIA